MNNIGFPLELRPRPTRGACSAPPDPLAVFKGPSYKGREGEEGNKERRERESEREGKRRGREGRGKEKKEGGGEGPAPNIFA